MYLYAGRSLFVVSVLLIIPALSGFLLLSSTNGYQFSSRQIGASTLTRRKSTLRSIISRRHGIFPPLPATKRAEESSSTISSSENFKHLLSQQVQKAMTLSSLSNQNISAAFEACSLWNDILRSDDKDKRLLPGNVRALCHALHATNLVRCGSDEAAIQSFDAALALQQHLDFKTQKSMMVGKASSLQRLLQYDKALEQFQSLKLRNISSSSVNDNSSVADGVLGAVTCAMRLGRLQTARALLEESGNTSIQANEQVQLMRTIICFLSLSQKALNIDQLEHSSLFSSTTKHSFLGHWVAAVLALQRKDFERVAAPTFVYQALLDINIGALDDPLLVHLDDKVLLHQVLTQQQQSLNETFIRCNNDFWPMGFILPDEFKQFEKLYFPAAKENALWMLKRRAGYGSHGNQVMDANQVVGLFRGGDATKLKADQVLLQKIVHPPLLLQDGRKFSLRIYVIYFISQQSPCSSLSIPEVYISSRGLVKIASIPFQSRTGLNENNNNNDQLRRMYMTNSGRERGMRQEELDFLQPLFHEKGLSYDGFWKDLKSVVQSVIRAHYGKVTSISSASGGSANNSNSNSNSDGDDDDLNRAFLRQRLARLGIPKVLGFDFVVDAHAQPWLVEVNRFPGLEPRDEQDQSVKHAVLGDAWRIAAQRMGMNYDDMKNSATTRASILERILL